MTIPVNIEIYALQNYPFYFFPLSAVIRVFGCTAFFMNAISCDAYNLIAGTIS